MQLAMIGLGRMGGNMAKRIAAAGHEVVGYDRSPNRIAPWQASKRWWQRSPRRASCG